MVAISLYRGNLHKVPDVPRRWLMPAPKISLKEFKSLLARRSKALSRLADGAVTTTTTTPSIPNLGSLSNGQKEVPILDKPSIAIQPESEKVSDNGAGHSREGEDHKEPELCNGSIKKTVDESDSLADAKTDAVEKASEPFDGDASLVVTKQTETIGDTEGLLNDKEKRKKEVEDKLEVLNAKKHNLVIALKQILNVEEELKRRTSVQGLTLRSSAPFQADGTNDTGSLTRHMIPRVGSEANLGDVEGSETDDPSNHNMHSRNAHWMNSMSPSESPLRRTPSVQQNMDLKVSQASRASMGGSGSPSRFALSQQGNAMNAASVSVSVSGTGYIASSPSPAASGGTSVFRDARHPSPWN